MGFTRENRACFVQLSKRVQRACFEPAETTKSDGFSRETRLLRDYRSGWIYANFSATFYAIFAAFSAIFTRFSHRFFGVYILFYTILYLSCLL